MRLLFNESRFSLVSQREAGVLLSKTPVRLRTLSDGVTSKVTCLEFRSSSVVQPERRELPLRGFLAAHPSPPHVHLTDFCAGKIVMARPCRRLPRFRVLRTAKDVRECSGHSFSSEFGPQHPAAIKDIFSEPVQKQHFSFTPSESVLPTSRMPLQLSCTSGRVLERHTTWGGLL